MDAVEETVETLPQNLQKSFVFKGLQMEAEVGIEPTMRLLQSPALPLGYSAATKKAYRVRRHLRKRVLEFLFSTEYERLQFRRFDW